MDNQQNQHGYEPYGTPHTPPGQGMAIASLVMGILGLVTGFFFAGLLFGILGIIFAMSARKQGYTGGIATAGLVTSIISVAFGGLMFLICTPLMCIGCMF